MDRLKPILSLLVGSPHLSNARIARLVGCDRRRVRRYRRLLAEQPLVWNEPLTPELLARHTPSTLNRHFNPRPPQRSKYRRLDFVRLERKVPNPVTGRALWRAYVAEHHADRPMCYATFMRQRAEAST